MEIMYSLRLSWGPLGAQNRCAPCVLYHVRFWLRAPVQNT